MDFPSVSSTQQKNVIFLSPQVLRPHKLNYAHMFELLSKSFCGYVFTMCSQSHKPTSIANFQLYSGALRRVRMLNWINRLYVQLVLPLWLLGRRARVDAVVAYDPYASGIPGIILKLMFGTKLIVQFMGDYHRLDPNDELVGEHGKLRKTGGMFKKLIMKGVMRISLSAADAVRVLNRDQEQFIRDQWPNKQVFRFSSFVATNYFSSLAVRQGDYLLAVGYPFHRKGIDVLLRAFSRIADEHPDIKLRILGYAPRSELESYRKLCGDHPRIEFIKAGWIEDVAELMRGCYAFVHAARSEAMGRVLLEAMACRKPVVSTKTSGGLDYVVDGETGILCEIEDVAGLASAINRLLTSPNLAEQMGNAGFEHLQKKFSEKRFSESFISMVEQVTK